MARLLALAVVAAAYGPTKPYQRAVPSVARRTTPSRPAPLAPLSAYNSTSVPEEFNLNEVMEREREEAPTLGLTSYKQFFAMIRLFRRVMIDRAEVTYRLRYDWSGKRIIATWYQGTKAGSGSSAKDRRIG
ncbi:DUF2358-containing protein [Aureococcus anophagefferens]|nr:DUF2358-containing protein [Aureococcus anophagefferens]